jgi:limonene-1,2-epoxide hydrolase
MTDTTDALLTKSREIFECWGTLDWDRILDWFTEDASFQSMMREPTCGRDNIRELFTHAMQDVTAVKLHLRNLVATGNVVIAERVDEFEIAGRTGRLPVVGVLEFRDGRIAAWRDYYDRDALIREMGLEADYAAGDA